MVLHSQPANMMTMVLHHPGGPGVGFIVYFIIVVLYNTLSYVRISIADSRVGMMGHKVSLHIFPSIRWRLSLALLVQPSGAIL